MFIAFGFQKNKIREQQRLRQQPKKATKQQLTKPKQLINFAYGYYQSCEVL